LTEITQTASGPHSILFPCEVNNSHQSGAEVKNEWSYTSISPIRVHGVERDNFTFISNHAVSSSEYIVSNCVVMISEQVSEQFVEVKGRIVFSVSFYILGCSN
jgi:hypothetical protein